VDAAAMLPLTDLPRVPARDRDLQQPPAAQRTAFAIAFAAGLIYLSPLRAVFHTAALSAVGVAILAASR
jgi:hypothetical protein